MSVVRRIAVHKRTISEPLHRWGTRRLGGQWIGIIVDDLVTADIGCSTDAIVDDRIMISSICATELVLGHQREPMTDRYGGSTREGRDEDNERRANLYDMRLYSSCHPLCPESAQSGKGVGTANPRHQILEAL